VRGSGERMGAVDMAGITLGQALTIVDVALRRARETGCAPLAVAVRRVAEQPQQRPFFSALGAMSGGRAVPVAELTGDTG
jgi:hypothetical protein